MRRTASQSRRLTAETTDGLGSIASLVRRVADAPGGSGPLVAPGDLIAGKFCIERRLGIGAMGVAYLAHDTRLDRAVALKIGVAIGPRALERVEREAIALARLSHPNVIVVHEVGEVAGRLFIAMEYAPGGTARRWLAAGSRTWREIVALYAAAGDGLAAAHAAGLVHRDFKPDNVLVGADGRPRVADFGLVQSADDGAVDPIAGTQGYMAPEQRRGRVDARADQFALAASVWEALFGDRPEAMASTVSAAGSDASVPVMADAPAAPAGHAIPRHIVAALRRALAETPDQRWPDVAHLVAELRRDPAAHRRRVAIVTSVVGAAVAAAVIVTARVTGGGPAPCTGPSELASTWNPARADRLAARFTGPGLAPIGVGVRTRLDAFARAWDAGQRDACRAAHVTRSQSETTFDRRALCLASARSRLAATIGALEHADRSQLAEAGDPVALLPDLARCADAGALDAQSALPADPVKRRAIEQVIEQLAVVRAQATTAVGADPVPAADAVVAGARATGWAPILAEASWVAASIHQTRGVAGGPSFDQAIELALASGADDVAAWALADLAWDTGDAADGPAARRLVGLARALWQRLGEPADIGTRLMGAVATAEMASGDFPAALAATREQVALAARAYPDDPLIAPGNHANLARALARAGQLPDAKREIDAALAGAIAVVGDDHPSVGRYRVLAGQIIASSGDRAAGLELVDAGVAVLERWYPPDDARLAPVLATQGGLLALIGDPRARPVLERVIGLYARVGGGIRQAEAQVNLAVLDAGHGEFAPALAAGTAAVATMERSLGTTNPELVVPLILIGYCERGLDRVADSTGHLRRAVAIADAAYGPDGYKVINPRIELATTLVAAGERRAATDVLAPAIALCDRDVTVPPPVAAEARALWAQLRGGR